MPQHLLILKILKNVGPFKVFVEFVKILFVFYVLVFLATRHAES